MKFKRRFDWRTRGPVVSYASFLGSRYQVAQLLASDWPFRPEEIETEVELWHGPHDHAAPLAHAEKLAAALPDGRLRVCEGYGHLGLVPALLPEVLTWLVEGGPASGS